MRTWLLRDPFTDRLAGIRAGEQGAAKSFDIAATMVPPLPKTLILTPCVSCFSNAYCEKDVEELTFYGVMVFVDRMTVGSSPG